MDPNTLTVKIVSPKGELFADSAKSVSSTNVGGKFDILPQHANFITLIENVPITVIKLNKEKAVFNFTLAIIYAIKNKVTVYTDIQMHLTS